MLSSSLYSPRKQIWHVEALETPRVLRHCPGCRRDSRFYCSDKFRINGHHRRLDVWLIYRCESCDTTWNHALHERILADALEPELLVRYESNDPELAWQEAFALAQRPKIQVDPQIRYCMTRVEVAPGCQGGALWIEVQLVHDLQLRLDRLLSKGLGISRKQLKSLVEGRQIQTEPALSLRRPARDGQGIWVSARALGSAVSY